ncbi:MAG: hypothetical protein NVV82_14805 [Sporocytophaga sp.]|nr:hypothetical protein [Sporocytophaga sp.]
MEKKLYVTNPFSNSDGITIPNMLKLESTSKAKPNDKIHKVPFDFGWKNIINKEIIGIRFYKGSIMTKKLFDFSLNKKYKSIQIIQFYFKYNSGSFCISAMDGDIGRSTFYPNGFLSDRVGFVFDKTIAESLTVSGLTINMKVIHKTSVKK